MPVTWKFDETTRLLTVSGHGEVTDEEYLAAHSGFITATAHLLGPRITLADWSEATHLAISADAIRTSVQMAGEALAGAMAAAAPAPDPGPHRMALVARTPLAYGLCRMWQAIAAHPMLQTEIFGDRGEALRWLGL
jgi:hypothetical protein